MRNIETNIMEKPNFFRKKLQNGMTVILEKRKGTGVLSLSFAVKYGGINEKAEEKGISHFIEHMLYKGTKNRDAKQISEEIEKKGGILNGFTDEEITAFWCKIPSAHINTALDVLADMLNNPLFDKEEVDKERKVIFEEMKMCKDTPQIYVMENLNKILFEGDFSIPIIGTYESMKKNTHDKLIEKFKKIYVPANMILCAVGDADFDNLCKFAEKNFQKKGPPCDYPKIQTKNEKIIEKRKGIDQASIIFAYHVPSGKNEQSYAAEVLNSITALGMSSRLFIEIREKRNLAYAIKGNSSIAKNFGFNSIYVGTSKENVKKVINLIIKEFKKLRNLKEKELNQAKEQLIGNSKIGREDSQRQMLDLLYCEIMGDAKKSYEYEDNIKLVKIEDVKKIAEEALNQNSFFALIPE